MDIGAAVVGAIAGTTWLTYYVYHNNYGIPVVYSIGKLVAIATFPGESDLRALTEHLTDRTREGSAHKTPCILCVATGPGTAPPPSTSSVDQCVMEAVSQMDTPQPWLVTEARKACIASLSAPGTTYNLSLDRDNCTIIKGMGGFPGNAGLEPRKYIEYRMGSTEQFTAGSPYQSIRPKKVYLTRLGGGSIAYGNEPAMNNVGIPLDVYYTPGAVTMGKRVDRPFLPPMVDDYKISDFVQAGYTHVFYCPKQWGFSQAEQNTFFLIMQEKGTDMALQHFLDEIGFKAYTVYHFNGNHYYSLEWIPSWNGSANTLTPLQNWSDDECRRYIDQYLRSTTMIPNGTQVARAGKRATRNGLLKLK